MNSRQWRRNSLNNWTEAQGPRETTMNANIDLWIAELLTSRLCHDIVGPIGAVNNGLELMADDELGMADDALQLATRSSAQATLLLQFFRLAYGSAGHHESGDLAALRELAADFLSHHKASLEWLPDPALVTLPGGTGKLLLNLVALAAEALPRGGSVTLVLRPEGNDVLVEATLQGVDAGFRPEVEEGLAEGISPDELTPRNIHGYFTRLVARRLGGDLAIEPLSPSSLRFSVILPA